MKTLLLLHAAATCYMCGVIWFVQLVHYPLFSAVGRGEFAAYQQQHMQRTGWVVGPVMFLEGVSALALCFFYPAGLSPVLLWVGVGMLVLIWLSTSLWQVPCHDTLLKGFDVKCHTWLVKSNWMRTGLWTIRLVLALYILPI